MSLDRRLRILHLIDQPAAARGGERPGDPDAELLACAALIERLPEFEQSVCLIGGNALEERAAGAGLAITDRIAPPLGRTSRAQFGLQALLRNRGRPDVIHSWRRATDGLAIGEASICSSALDGESSIPGATNGISVTRRLRQLSNPPDSDHGVARHSALPRIDLRVSGKGRREFRHQLGVRDGEPVVFLLGGRPDEADAVRLVFLLGLLETADRPATWVIPGSSARMARGLRCFALTPHRARLVVSDRPFAELAAGADLGVWLGGAWADSVGGLPSPAGALLIGAAMGAGVPVVAPGGSLTDGLYPPNVARECRAFNATVAEVARVLLPLVGDAGRIANLRESLLAERPPLGEPFERIVAEQWLAVAQSRAAYSERR